MSILGLSSACEGSCETESFMQLLGGIGVDWVGAVGGAFVAFDELFSAAANDGKVDFGGVGGGFLQGDGGGEGGDVSRVIKEIRLGCSKRVKKGRKI